MSTVSNQCQETSATAAPVLQFEVDVRQGSPLRLVLTFPGVGLIAFSQQGSHGFLSTQRAVREKSLASPIRWNHRKATSCISSHCPFPRCSERSMYFSRQLARMQRKPSMISEIIAILFGNPEVTRQRAIPQPDTGRYQRSSSLRPVFFFESALLLEWLRYLSGVVSGRCRPISIRRAASDCRLE